MPMADDAAIELGYRYRSDAVVADDGQDGLFVDPHEPAAVPGVRAPHVALEGGSTLDLLGHSFVVLTSDEGWERAAEGIGVEAHRIRSPGFEEVYGRRRGARPARRLRRLAERRRPVRRRPAGGARPGARPLSAGLRYQPI